MTIPDPPRDMDHQNRDLGDANDIRSLTGPEENPDESALRRLLHDVVQDIEPAPDALEHLRRAVPARKARHRQIMVGAAAACLLAVAAVPAMLHATTTTDSRSASAANASHAQDAGGSSGVQDTGGEDSGDQPADTEMGGSKQDSGKKDSGKKTGTASPTASPSHGATPSANSSDTLAATAPICTSADLGNASGHTGDADSGGKVYGWFRISNISANPCIIDGGGSVTPTAQGSADSSRIQVVDHTADDAATDLPDTPAGALILKPGGTYEIQFAWIPASGDTITGCATTADPSPSTGTTDGASGGTTTSNDATSNDAAPTTESTPSIELSHTPEAGAPVATTTIPHACAGTVYRTGTLSSTQ